MSITNRYTNAHIPPTSPCANLRCRLPAEPILARKIPLPAILSVSRQGTDSVFVSVFLGRLFDAETVFLPELREEPATRRRPVAGAAAAIRRPARGCRDRSS